MFLRDARNMSFFWGQDEGEGVVRGGEEEEEGGTVRGGGETGRGAVRRLTQSNRLTNYSPNHRAMWHTMPWLVSLEYA